MYTCTYIHIPKYIYELPLNYTASLLKISTIREKNINFIINSVPAHIINLETFSVYNRWTRFIIFRFGDPHRLESR